MKVLMSADTVGGVWTYALELADALARRRVDVTLATMGAPLRPEQERELRRVRVRECHVSEFALEWMEEPWDDVDRAGAWVLGLADELRPDVVHLNGYAHACLPWPAPVLVVGHSDVLSWHEAVRGGPAGPEWERYRDAVTAGLAAAGLLVAPTRALLDELVRLYRPRCPTLVIPNGTSRTPPERAKEPFVLCAGRLWDDAKNAAALVRVAPRLPWPVVLAGTTGVRPEGAGGFAAGASRPGSDPVTEVSRESDVSFIGPPARDEMETFEPRSRVGTAGVRPGSDPVTEVSREGGVRSVGRLGREEMDEAFARAAIFAEPARYEPFGLAALEAGRAGCALVLGDIPSLREVWSDAALYVPPDDDAALERALRDLIEDDALRSGLAARARARAAELTAERMADAYLDAYARLGASEEAAA